ARRDREHVRRRLWERGPRRARRRAERAAARHRAARCRAARAGRRGRAGRLGATRDRVSAGDRGDRGGDRGAEARGGAWNGQVLTPRGMSTALESVQQAYGFAKRADHRKLRELVADDATWSPAREGQWNPCRDGDTVVQTMLWRSGSANKLRPGEAIELGYRVVI